MLHLESYSFTTSRANSISESIIAISRLVFLGIFVNKIIDNTSDPAIHLAGLRRWLPRYIIPFKLEGQHYRTIYGNR